MSEDLPAVTVTFLFTDIEGSTRLLRELGADAYAAALAEHRRVLREAFAVHGGVEVDTQGDAFFVVFPTADGAVAAAAAGQERLLAGPIRVRMGVHTVRCCGPMTATSVRSFIAQTTGRSSNQSSASGTPHSSSSSPGRAVELDEVIARAVEPPGPPVR